MFNSVMDSGFFNLGGFVHKPLHFNKSHLKGYCLMGRRH